MVTHFLTPFFQGVKIGPLKKFVILKTSIDYKKKLKKYALSFFLFELRILTGRRCLNQLS